MEELKEFDENCGEFCCPTMGGWDEEDVKYFIRSRFISKQSLLTWIEQRMKRTSKKKGLRAEENRNGYNQALKDLKQFINETKKETND
jgi:hypothetical protein